MADDTEDQARATRNRRHAHYLQNKEKYHQATQRWRERNPDHVKRASAARWAKMSETDRQAARIKARERREADEAGKEAARQRTRKWAAENRQRKRDSDRKRIAENPEANRKRVRQWSEANPERTRALKSNRSALLRKAGGKHTASDIAFLMKIQRHKCAHSWCRKSLVPVYRVDHVIPVALGGSNNRSNLQLLCKPCNHRKHAKHPIDFARENGMLL